MLLIDGIIFSLQQHGGISVYFQTLLKYIVQNRIKATLLLENPIRQNIKFFDSTIEIASRQARIFERYRSCRVLGDNTIFHSSYYRLPAQHNLPTVVTVHDFVYERYMHGPKKWVHTFQKHSAIRAAQAIICVSESTKLDLLHYVSDIPDQSIHVIHNGVSDVFKPLEIELAESPFILFVGQRSGYKNFKLILAAMAYLPEFELHCVGGGAIRPVEMKGGSEAVVSRVRHLGFVADDELNILYNRAACLVYPSSYEGFGIPVIEAMKAGCPVVSLDCKAVLEVGRDALSVVCDDDPKAMAGAILNTLSSGRASLIQRGLAVAQAYSWDKTHSRTLEVYRSLGA